MLVFSRKEEQGFVINLESLLTLSNSEIREVLAEDITVSVVDIRAAKVRLGINAHPKIAVHRDEVWESILRERRATP